MATVSHHTASASAGTARGGMPDSSRAMRRKAPTTRSSSSGLGIPERSTSASGSLKHVSSTRSPSAHACWAQARASWVFPVPAPPRTTTTPVLRQRFQHGDLRVAQLGEALPRGGDAGLGIPGELGVGAEVPDDPLHLLSVERVGIAAREGELLDGVVDLGEVGGHQHLGADHVGRQVTLHRSGVGQRHAVLDLQVLEPGGDRPEALAQGVGVVAGLVDGLRLERGALLAEPDAVPDVHPVALDLDQHDPELVVEQDDVGLTVAGRLPHPHRRDDEPTVEQLVTERPDHVALGVVGQLIEREVLGDELAHGAVSGRPLSESRPGRPGSCARRRQPSPFPAVARRCPARCHSSDPPISGGLPVSSTTLDSTTGDSTDTRPSRLPPWSQLFSWASSAESIGTFTAVSSMEKKGVIHTYAGPSHGWSDGGVTLTTPSE